MNKIPLSIRLLRLEDGGHSDPDCIQSMIKNMANTPIGAYLCGFGDELDWLMTALDIPAEQSETLTYQDVAVCVAKHADKSIKAEAVQMLSLPFYHRYSERIAKHEKNTA